MKLIHWFFGILFLIVIASACGTAKNAANQQGTIKFEAKNDSVEYELIIIDQGFETWLLTNAKPKAFYSQTYYENWNQQYVNEWNNRYTSGMSPNLYESYVDYDPNIDYGLDLNYKLYNYFRYFEESNNLTLIPRAGR
jgi:hypothetical protein